MSNVFWVGREENTGNVILWKIIILKAISMAILDFDRSNADKYWSVLPLPFRFFFFFFFFLLIKIFSEGWTPLAKIPGSAPGTDRRTDRSLKGTCILRGPNDKNAKEWCPPNPLTNDPVWNINPNGSEVHLQKTHVPHTFKQNNRASSYCSTHRTSEVLTYNTCMRLYLLVHCSSMQLFIIHELSFIFWCFK